MTQVEEKKEFSWMGLLFGGAYYAGYGQFVKGLIMAVISFIPLTMIPVHIYAGIKAKKQLPVGGQPFKWAAAAVVFIIPVILGSGIILFAQGGIGSTPEADFRADITGYWDGGDGVVMIDLENAPYKVGAAGQVFPVTVRELDAQGGKVFLELPNKNIIAFSFLDNGSLMFVADNNETILRFIRDL